MKEIIKNIFKLLPLTIIFELIIWFMYILLIVIIPINKINEILAIFLYMILSLTIPFCFMMLYKNEKKLIKKYKTKSNQYNIALTIDLLILCLIMPYLVTILYENIDVFSCSGFLCDLGIYIMLIIYAVYNFTSIISYSIIRMIINKKKYKNKSIILMLVILALSVLMTISLVILFIQ